MAVDQEFTSGEAPFNWDESEASEPDPVVEEPEAPEEPEDPLAELDGDTRAVVEKWYSSQQEKQRASFQELGLDLNAEGKPLIADASKVAGWAGVAPTPRQQPVQQAPAPAAAPPTAEEGEEPFDLLSADTAALERLIDRRAALAMKPLQERNAHLERLLQQDAESEAMTQVRSIVEKYIPEIATALDHPDFEASYRQQLAAAPAEYLKNPTFVASLVGLVRANLDPARMPAPRDPQGRFAPQMTEVQMRNQSNRAALAQTPPARGGAPSRNAPDPVAEQGARFLAHFQSQLPTEARKNLTATREAYEDAQYTDIESWKAAKAARSAAGTRRR